MYVTGWPIRFNFKCLGSATTRSHPSLVKCVCVFIKALIFTLNLNTDMWFGTGNYIFQWLEFINLQDVNLSSIKVLGRVKRGLGYSIPGRILSFVHNEWLGKKMNELTSQLRQVLSAILQDLAQAIIANLSVSWFHDNRLKFMYTATTDIQCLIQY